MYKHILPQSCEKVNVACEVLCKTFVMISSYYILVSYDVGKSAEESEALSAMASSFELS